MGQYLIRTIYISIAVLLFFLVLSLVTDNWGFFLWSLAPVFFVLMTAIFSKKDQK
jgi:cadmium resistance protein CadD (predicted permease)